MKVSRFSAMLCAVSFLFAASVLAGETNKKSIHFNEPVTVAGQQLQPGDYKCEWSGSGPTVQVDIQKGKQTVATVTAQVVDGTSPNTQDGYALKSGQDGSKEVTELFFDGQNYTLKFQPQTGSQTTNPSGNR